MLKLSLLSATAFLCLGSLHVSAHHSVTPSSRNRSWSIGSAPTPKPGYRSNVGGWLVRDEALRRQSGYTPGSGSCVRNPLTCSSNDSANPKSIFPAFAADRLGGKFLNSKFRSVRVFSADIRKKSGGEMRVAVRLYFDGFSKKTTPPLRRTTVFWAPDKTYTTNLGFQCESDNYRASGLSGFVNADGPWGLERHFSFDTDKATRCDDWFTLTGASDQHNIINTGDFPDPVEVTVLSNNYAVAYVRCYLTTQTCQWTYPSIWSKGTSSGSMWTDAFIGADHTDYRDSIHRGWTRAFANADKVTSQPIDQTGGQLNQNLSIAAQSMYILKARCAAVADKLSETTSANGSAATTVIDTGENCLRYAGTGSSNNSISPYLVVDPRAIGKRGSSPQDKNVCQLLSTSVRQKLATELTRLGRPHSARCTGV